MATWIKQSTAITIRLGPYLDKTDGFTEETALSPAVEVCKNHAAWAARSSAGAIAHDSNGWYSVPIDATDTGTLGPLMVKSDSSADHLPVWREFMVVAAHVYDGLIAGGDYLQVDMLQTNSSTTAAARLALSAAQITPGTVTNAAFTPTSSAFEVSDITEATASHYNGRLVLWTTGVLAGQVTDVTAYSLVGGRGKFTVTTMTEAPGNGDTFVLV